MKSVFTLRNLVKQNYKWYAPKPMSERIAATVKSFVDFQDVDVGTVMTSEEDISDEIVF